MEYIAMAGWFLAGAGVAGALLGHLRASDIKRDRDALAERLDLHTKTLGEFVREGQIRLDVSLDGIKEKGREMDAIQKEFKAKWGFK